MLIEFYVFFPLTWLLAYLIDKWMKRRRSHENKESQPTADKIAGYFWSFYLFVGLIISDVLLHKFFPDLMNWGYTSPKSTNTATQQNAPAVQLDTVTTPTLPHHPASLTYQTVFDGTQPITYNAGSLVVALIVIAVSGYMVLRPKQFLLRFPKFGLPENLTRRAGLFMLPVSLLFLATSHWGMEREVERSITLYKEVQQGLYPVVEGPVRNFVPEPPNTRGSKESFDVQGTHFWYSRNFITHGFHRSNLNGGPMREGLWVRITYEPYQPDGNVILKLEVGNQ